MNAVVLALAVLFAPADTSAARVNGRVVDARSGRGIASAIVQLNARAVQRTTFTSEDGTYGFDDVVADEYVLSVLHPGYDNGRIRLAIRAGSALTIDLPLEPVPVPVPGLHVVGAVTRESGRERPVEEDADLRARLEQLGRTGRHAAGALGDLALADMAREPRPDDPGGRQPHVLYVWGSSAERGRITLDGATINAPLHLGGILPPLDPDLLERAELRTAGSSARYDGGTSYIMDFATRPPSRDSIGGRADIDLLTSTATLDAPLGSGAGLLVGARHVNSDLVETVLGRRFGYDYSDALAHIDTDLSAGRLSVTGFATREAIHMPRDLGEDVADWRNLVGAVSLRGSTGRANASCSRGLVDLPLLSAPEGHVEATGDRCAIAGDLSWTAGNTSITTGFEVEHLRFAQRTSGSTEPDVDQPTKSISCTPALPCADVSTTYLSPWAEAAWRIAGNVSVRAGMRAGWEPDQSRFAALPRMAVTLFNHDASTALTVSAGRYSQTNAFDVTQTTSGTTAPTGSLHTGVSYASQIEVHVARRSTRSALGASLLLHRYEGGNGLGAWTSPGGELSWAWTDGIWTATLGYSVLGRRRTPRDSTAEYQHMAAASIATTRGRVSLGLSGAWGSGMPLTSVVLEEPSRTEAISAPGDGLVTNESPRPLDDRTYFRVDARLGAEWAADVFGRSMRLTPYARLVNGLSRRDALFYYQEAGPPGEPQPLAALASLPVLGLRIEF